ncbi:MAG: T9SS type A sorting domain-containing protein [Croceitalea sp.]|nr:T9SS type A sorting domain-containing protein [Croceitalea sp.]
MNRYVGIVLLLFSITIRGQDCNCDITLSNLSSSSINIVQSNTVEYEPGHTLCIPAGTYAGIEFIGFEGEDQNPLLITNCGGQVVIMESNKSGITFRNSRFIRLSGTGDLNVTYGFKVENATGPGAVGINVADFSSDIEIDNIEIQNTAFAGILGKTDPKCDDEDTWRRNGYVLRNLNIHDNYIHHTGGEGIYLGYTGGYKVSSNLICGEEYIFGHWLENITIHHNQLEHIGWDGIQTNLVRFGGVIFENTITFYGLENKQFQNFAMSVGGGNYTIYNNTIINSINGFGQGIQLISANSGSKLFNNVIINPQFHGIFIHNRHEFDNPNEGYYVLNNTIINPAASGVFYNTTITESENSGLISNSQENVPTLMVNNLIANPGNHYEQGNTWKGNAENYFDFNKRKTQIGMGSNIYSNIKTRQIDTLCLASIEDMDFRPGSEASPLVDAGSDMTIYGAPFDRNQKTRFVGSGMDIGAFEYQNEILNWNCFGYGDDIYNDPTKYSTSTIAFPNPTKKYIRLYNLNYQVANLQIFTLEGNLVHGSNYELGSSIDMGDFAKGIYFIALEFDEYSEVHKIILE